MADEIKDPKAQQQAPAQAKPEEKKEEKVEEKKPAGLDGLTVDQLKDFYKKSPQMFKEAGIVQEEKKEEPKPPEPKPQSAAPAYEGQEIKLPEDVPVNRDVVDRYLKHAKEVGLSAVQVQKEIDFNAQSYREAIKATPKQPTPQEVDQANVALLKADKDFGGKYDENMEVARRAAVKHASPEMLERLKTSDPVLVKHFWDLGKKDGEDVTRGGPNRNGTESGDQEKAIEDHLRARYPKTPQMFKTP